MIEYYPFHILNDEKNNIDIQELKDILISEFDILVFFRGDNIICEKQINAALLRAYRAEINGTMIANKVPMEIYLQLSGNHQIDVSLKLFELNEKNNDIIIIQTKKQKIIDLSIPGYPKFYPNKTIIDKYGIKSALNWCDLVIAKGARLIADYE